MQGGWNDVLYKEASSLISSEKELLDMIKRLEKLKYADDAAESTKNILLKIKQFKKEIEDISERLMPIWTAVEFKNEDNIKLALSKFRFT